MNFEMTISLFIRIGASLDGAAMEVSIESLDVRIRLVVTIYWVMTEF